MATGAVPAVLLLHGQPGDRADWDGVVSALNGRVQTIAHSRPGWDGASPALDLEGNARAALAALDARGIGRAVIVGHSLGAAVATWLAAGRPDRVAALVLAAPAANLAALYPLDRWLAAPIAAEFASTATIGGLGLVLTVGPVRRRIAGVTGIDEGYLNIVRRAALKPSAWRAYASEQRTLIRDLPQLERRLADITAPTTILTGARDRIVPPRAARALARQISGARLVVAPDAGHLLPHRAPELMADVILTALADCAASTLGDR